MTSSSTPRMHTYKRTSSPRSPTNTGELFTPAHEENVRFIHDTWLCVLRDIKCPQNHERNDRGPQEYVEKNPNPNLHSFIPVDLSDLKKRNTQDSKKSQTVRSLSDPQVFILFIFCPPFYIRDLFTLSVFYRPTKIHTSRGYLPTFSPESSFFSAHGPASGLTGCRLFMLYVFQSRLSHFSYSSRL